MLSLSILISAIDGYAFDYDIALVNIKENIVNGRVRGIQFHKNAVEKAELPEKWTDIFNQKDCYISGWGRNDSGKDRAHKAKH